MHKVLLVRAVLCHLMLMRAAVLHLRVVVSPCLQLQKCMCSQRGVCIGLEREGFRGRGGVSLDLRVVGLEAMRLTVQGAILCFLDLRRLGFILRGGIYVLAMGFRWS